MIEIIIYTVYLVSLVLGALWIKRTYHDPTTRYTSYVILSLIVSVFSIFNGSRFKVGIDYEAYMLEYQHIMKTGVGSLSDGDRWEYFYALITNTFADYQFHFSSLFIATSFFQIIFFFGGHLNKRLLFLLPLSSFFLVTYLLGTMNNVMRQYIAFMIIFCGTTFIFKRSVIRYSLTIFLASLFHKSAIVLLPFYYIVNRDNIFKGRVMQYILIGISFILGKVLLSYFWNTFSSIFISLGYSAYDLSEGRGETQIAQNTGLGTLLSWIMIFMIVYYYPYLSRIFKASGFQIYYNLFFIGVLLRPIFGSFMVMNRINVYFYSFRFIIAAYLCYYLFYISSKFSDRVVGFVFVSIALLIFYYEIFTGANGMTPFNFYWS